MASPQEWAESLLARAQAKSLGTKEVFSELTDLLKNQNKNFFNLQSALSNITRSKTPLSLDLKGPSRGMPLDLKGLMHFRQSSDKVTQQINKGISATNQGLEGIDKSLNLIREASKVVRFPGPDEQQLGLIKNYLETQKEALDPSLDEKKIKATQKNVKILQDGIKDLTKETVVVQTKTEHSNIEKTLPNRKLAKAVTATKEKFGPVKSTETVELQLEAKDIDQALKRIDSQILEATAKNQPSLKLDLIKDKQILETRKNIKELAISLQEAFSNNDIEQVIEYEDSLQAATGTLKKLTDTFNEDFKKAVLSDDFSKANKLLDSKQLEKLNVKIKELEGGIDDAINNGDVEQLKEYGGQLRQARTQVLLLGKGFDKTKARGRQAMSALSSKMGQFISLGAGLGAIWAGFREIQGVVDEYTKQQVLLNMSMDEFSDRDLSTRLADTGGLYAKAAEESGRLSAALVPLGAKMEEVNEISNTLRSRIRGLGQNAEQSSKLLLKLTKRAFVASKVLGIDTAKATELIERDMWKFGKSAAQAGTSMLDFRDMVDQTNRSLGDGALRVEDFVNILDEASSSTTRYAQDTRFLGTIVRQHIERIQKLGATYQESIDSAKELAKTLTTDTPELVKYQAGKIILNTIATGRKEINKVLAEGRELTKQERAFLEDNIKKSEKLSATAKENSLNRLALVKSSKDLLPLEKSSLAYVLALENAGARNFDHAKKIAAELAVMPDSLRKQNLIMDEIGGTAQGQLAVAQAAMESGKSIWINQATAAGASEKSAAEQWLTMKEVLKIAKEQKQIASEMLLKEKDISAVRISAMKKQARGNQQEFERLKTRFQAETVMVQNRLEKAQRSGDDKALREASLLKLARSFGTIREKEETASYIKTAMIKRGLTEDQAKREMKGIHKQNELRKDATALASKRLLEVEGLVAIATGSAKEKLSKEMAALKQKIENDSFAVVLEFKDKKAEDFATFSQNFLSSISKAVEFLDSPLGKIVSGISFLGGTVALLGTQSLQLRGIKRAIIEQGGGTVEQGILGRTKDKIKEKAKKGIQGAKNLASKGIKHLPKGRGGKIGLALAGAALIGSFFTGNAEADEQEKQQNKQKDDLITSVKIKAEQNQKNTEKRAEEVKKKGKGLAETLKDKALGFLTSDVANIASLALMFAPIPGARVLSLGIKAFRTANMGASLIKEIPGAVTTEKALELVKSKIPDSLKNIALPKTIPKETVVQSLSRINEGPALATAMTSAPAIGASPQGTQAARANVLGMKPNGTLKLEVTNWKDIMGLVNQQNTIYR